MADNNETEFPKGIIVKAPRDGAPDFVKATISIKRLELAEWLLQEREGEWINLDVKEAKSGKWYCSVNTYKPKDSPINTEKPAAQSTDFSEDIPFN